MAGRAIGGACLMVLRREHPREQVSGGVRLPRKHAGTNAAAEQRRTPAPPPPPACSSPPAHQAARQRSSICGGGPKEELPPAELSSWRPRLARATPTLRTVRVPSLTPPQPVHRVVKNPNTHKLTYIKLRIRRRATDVQFSPPKQSANQWLATRGTVAPTKAPQSEFFNPYICLKLTPFPFKNKINSRYFNNEVT